MGITMKKQQGYNRPDYPLTRSPLKAIRWFCLDCVAGSHAEVERCADRCCSLYRFRFGVSPSTAKKRGKDIGR